MVLGSLEKAEGRISSSELLARKTLELCRYSLMRHPARSLESQKPSFLHRSRESGSILPLSGIKLCDAELKGTAILALVEEISSGHCIPTVS